MKSTKRIFIPGSEWIYFKVYAGNKTIENILSHNMASITNELKKGRLIEKWFFIRYADPDPHLRIRFLLKSKQDSNKILNLVYFKLNYFVQHNLIWKIQIDTYNRELERYGDDLIEESETIFFHDSECVLSIIQKLNTSLYENHRWMVALKLIDSFLSDFSFDLQMKQQFLESLSQSFKSDFGFNEYNSKQFNVKFRENKNLIKSVLADKETSDDFDRYLKPIGKRSRHLRVTIDELSLKLKKTNRAVSMESLLSSYIHMCLNRLFISKNRTYELVLYDFLRRYYTSEIAKSKYMEK